MSINELQEQIIAEFSVFDDWMDRYNYLIELGGELPGIDPKFRTDEFLINGCQSKVWLNAEYKNGIITYTADSDAIIVKGIVALLVRVLNKQKASEIMNIDLYFIDKIGLKENLSPTRSNGLLSMVKQMKLYALAYHSKYEGNKIN
ncbi:MAG: SufE family protein [Bacteroidales bacterium]|nr:SufE family protein [Bacteroidales bacterium]MCF8390675.1 SufE family protein [Bacteroidales bacterium]